MALPSVFEQSTVDALINRINQLTPASAPKWGKMNVEQMLAHSNVTYEYALDERDDKPNFLVKMMLKNFVKNKVVSETPYTESMPTGPAFVIKESKDFDKEKTRLINYINKVKSLGAAHYEGKESSSFGVLTSAEWNNMMYKHIDHHLKQFGV